MENRKWKMKINGKWIKINPCRVKSKQKIKQTKTKKKNKNKTSQNNKCKLIISMNIVSIRNHY